MEGRAAAVIAGIVALAAAALYYFMGQDAPADGGSTDSGVSPLPTDPAGRRARARTAIMSQDTSPIPGDWLYYQAQLETGDFNSATYYGSNSLFNRHVGSGKGDWTGRVYMNGTEYASDADALADDPTNALEHIRIYDDPEQSVRDIMQLYNDPLYAPALAAAHANNRDAFFAALANGNGTQGYVGPSHATKATNYVAGLVATANRGVVA